MEIIATFRIIDEERPELTGFKAGAEGSENEAHSIGEKVHNEILPKLNPESRFLYDLTITGEPDEGMFFREENELWRNYSATYSWSKRFTESCISPKGFEVL